MLYEQQRAAGANLAKIEKHVRVAREHFTAQLLKKRCWESQEGVDKLFNEGSNAEISNILKTIEKSHKQSKFNEGFESKIDLDKANNKP